MWPCSRAKQIHCTRPVEFTTNARTRWYEVSDENAAHRVPWIHLGSAYGGAALDAQTLRREARAHGTSGDWHQNGVHAGDQRGCKDPGVSRLARRAVGADHGLPAVEGAVGARDRHAHEEMGRQDAGQELDRPDLRQPRGGRHRRALGEIHYQPDGGRRAESAGPSRMGISPLRRHQHGRHDLHRAGVHSPRARGFAVAVGDNPGQVHPGHPLDGPAAGRHLLADADGSRQQHRVAQLPAGLPRPVHRRPGRAQRAGAALLDAGGQHRGAGRQPPEAGAGAVQAGRQGAAHAPPDGQLGGHEGRGEPREHPSHARVPRNGGPPGAKHHAHGREDGAEGAEPREAVLLAAPGEPCGAQERPDGRHPAAAELGAAQDALDRQEKKLQDAKLASSTLRDELADARTELSKALQSQQRSAATVMEEKLEQIASSNKEKSSKFDDQLSELSKKQKKLEEATKTLQETMSQVKVEASQRFSRSPADREEENDKLRQRLARSVAELEALANTKAEVERRFASEEQQFQARLKELRTSLTETEKQKEAQRLELMQKLQEESKLMGVAQGKNSLLENLLAREKAENEEKNELVRKSKKEVAEVREQIRNLESEKEKKVRQLSSELQAKQTQVGLLTKTLKRIETASAKMLDLSKREAKTVRRVKATKEHELFIAQLKLKEMERVAQALQNGDEMKKQAALTAASTEERNELEKLLLESQLEKDELKQELEEMTEEFNAAKESQKVIMEDTITKLSSDYDEKIGELKQQIADKEQAMRQLRDTLVEKSNLDALEDELAALKDEKNDLLEQIQRAQIEHERVTLNTETTLRLEHATEFAAMKSKFEERISELEGAQSELETTKVTITELEKELEKQEVLHQREVSTLTHDIKEARSKIDEFTAQILDLEEAKTRLEGEVSQMEANIGGASAEKEEELAAIKSQMQSEVDRLRAELSEVSSTLEEKQMQLKAAKQSDETNRQKLVEMAMAQEEMQSRYISQIDSLTLKLNQERESSRAREADLEDTIDKLNADVKSLKAESNKELEAARSELTDQMTSLTTTLKDSQHREQQLQSRLKRILEELVQAANASGDNDVVEDSGDMSDDDAITHHLDALYATHRRTAHELERLQAEYELTVKQAAADSATAQELDNQVKEHETQIRELESVVEQLREELKEQYHKSAVIAKGSDEFSEEMASLREEKRQLERQLQEEEKDRAKREVSYQRRTEMKEREVEELRTENKTLTAAVAAVREKIRAVENAKFHDLSELQSKLKDLEERTAALQPDEDNVANIEKNFTSTRQEIVTLTAEVQSLYQKLTACCGIMEWSELRASVFDEEEKLTRVRSESARELAKVQSVEQEVLMNAEFLNALLVAHGSGGDGNLLNDFRWMQKYASIAPEIVEKLRNVESRLRDAVLDLHDGSTSLFAEGISKAPASSVSADASADGVVPQAPSSQNSAVDGAAIALALEKARENYFTESDQELDEGVKQDMDQPDVEQESPVDVEEEGASSDNVDVDGEDSIGEISHNESRTDAELVVAEHVVRDEQERSHEEQAGISVAMSNIDEDEDSSDDVAEDSFKSRQDRIDDDGVGGLESSVDRKIEETKVQSKWSSVGFTGDSEDDDMDEVERLMLEQSLAHSSKQVKPHIDNECDDSDEFAHDDLVHDKTEKPAAAVVDDDDEVSSTGSELKDDVFADSNMSHRALDQTEQSCDRQDVSSVQRAVVDDDLGEVSSDGSEFADHGLAASLDINTSRQDVGSDQAAVNDDEHDDISSDGSTLNDDGLTASTDSNINPQAIDQTIPSDAEHDASQDASSDQAGDELDPLEESSFDNAMMAALEGKETSAASYMDAVPQRPMHSDEVEGEQSDSDGFTVQDAIAENSFDNSMMSENEDESIDSRGNIESYETDVGAEQDITTEIPLPAEHDQLENSFDGDDPHDTETSAVERTLHVECHDGDGRTLKESTASSTENAGLPGQLHESNALDEPTSSLNELTAHINEMNALEDSAASMQNVMMAGRIENHGPLEEVSSSVERGDPLEDSASEEASASLENSAEDDQLSEDEALEESASSMGEVVTGDPYREDSRLEESSPSVDSEEVADQYEEDNTLEESTPNLERDVSGGHDIEEHALEEPTPSVSMEGDTVGDQLDEKKSSSIRDRSAVGNEFDEDSALEESASSITGHAMIDQLNASEESVSRMKGDTLGDQLDEDITLDNLSSNGRGALANEFDEDSELEDSAVADRLYQNDELEESSRSITSEELPVSGKTFEPLPSVSRKAHEANTVLEELASNMENSVVNLHGDDNELEDPNGREASPSRVDNAGVAADKLHEPDILEESIRRADQADEQNVLEESLSNVTSGTLMDQHDEDDALEMLASRLSSGSSFQRETSRDRYDSRYTYGDPLVSEHDGDDDTQYHSERGVVAVSRSDPLAESSFDEDNVSDHDDEVSAGSAPTLPTKPLHSTDDEDYWSEEQIRAAERSLDSAIALGDDQSNSAGERSDCSEESAAPPAMSLRMEADEGSSEEETMVVQSQPAFAPGLNRFGMGAGRLNLEEDDDMDEVERLLLEQSSSTINKQRLPRLNRFTRPAVNIDDEFGETSLQSLGGDDDEFGETSLQSREDEFGEISIQSDENKNTTRFSGAMAPYLSHDEESIRSISRGDDEFGEASIKSRSQEDDQSVTSLVQSRESKSDMAPVPVGTHRLGTLGVASILKRLQDHDEFGESSFESRHANEHYHTPSLSRPRDESDEFSQASEDEDEFGEASIPSHKGDFDRTTQRFGEGKFEAPAAPSLISDEFGEIPARPRPATEFGEASNPVEVEDDEFGEISIPLHDDASVGAQAYSRSHGAPESTHTTTFAERSVTHHEGLMSSPAKLTTNANTTAAATTIHDDSASEAENDYMDESFDLDESLEEDDDDNERHIGVMTGIRDRPWSTASIAAHNYSQEPHKYFQGEHKPYVLMTHFRSVGVSATRSVEYYLCCPKMATGLFGVENEHFSSMFALRESLTVSSQMYQAFRTSTLLPSVKVNGFSVALLVVACWSTVVTQYFLKRSPALQRVVTLLSDALTSFCMVVMVPLIIFVPFVNSYSFQSNGFKNEDFLNDTTSLALFSQESRLIFAANLGDFVSKIIPHMGIFLSLVGVTELIGSEQAKISPCENSVDEAVELNSSHDNQEVKTPLKAPSSIADESPTPKLHGCWRRLSPFYRWKHVFIGVVFFFWGLLVLALHIAAAQRAANYEIVGCRAITRPWTSTGKDPCSSLVYDCYARNTTSLDDATLNALDPNTLAGLAIVHCPALNMPTKFQVFTNLMMIHVYNSTIGNWDVDSSISASKHTRLIAVLMRKIQMTELPTGMLQPLPVSLKSIQLSEANLSVLPEDLSARWHAVTFVAFDDGALTEIPESFFSIGSYVISIARNQIKAVPALANMAPGTVIPVLRLAGNPLPELPAELKTPQAFIMSLDVRGTEISSIPAWVQSQTRVVWAFDTPFCRASTSNPAAPVECFDTGTITAPEFPSELFDRLYHINKMD
ncbi:hypothetical protein ON010_g342 [Phytophthora cinnamomi]|nr:hypothetical protein ON010_g342 [Phytophthora cinnamomi]